MKEIWVYIKNYDVLYQVSNFGYVKRRNKTLKPSNRNGYKSVVLCKNGKTKTFQVHRLVAQAFIPNPHNLPQVNHKDGNKLNNCVENLEWITASNNRKHAIGLGLINFRTLEKPIYQIKNGEIVNIFNSISDASRKYNLDPSSICKVLHGKMKHTKGFYFQYK